MLKSRVILAMDKPLSYQILKEMENELYGIKIGLPLVLDLGVHKTRELLNDLNVEEIIVDFKLADIGFIMKSVVEKLSFASSFIAHSFIGVKGSLDELKKYLDASSKNLYLVAVMSHEGWSTLFTDYIKNVIREISPKGIVVGGTKLDSITEYRKDFGKMTIISPGMGSQGGSYGDAVCAGANYEIIGRSIYNAENPFAALRTINKIIEDKVMNCKGAIFREK